MAGDGGKNTGQHELTRAPAPERVRASRERYAHYVWWARERERLGRPLTSEERAEVLKRERQRLERERGITLGEWRLMEWHDEARSMLDRTKRELEPYVGLDRLRLGVTDDRIIEDYVPLTPAEHAAAVERATEQLLIAAERAIERATAIECAAAPVELPEASPGSRESAEISAEQPEPSGEDTPCAPQRAVPRRYRRAVPITHCETCGERLQISGSDYPHFALARCGCAEKQYIPIDSEWYRAWWHATHGNTNER